MPMLSGSASKTEIALAAPKAVEKRTKIISQCVSMVAQVRGVLEEALDLAAKSPNTEKLQLAYEKNCVVRLHILNVWESPNVAMIPSMKELPSQPGQASIPIKAVERSGGEDAQPSPQKGGDAKDAKGAAEDADKSVMQSSPTKPDDAKSSAGESSDGSSSKVTKALQKALQQGGSSAQHVSNITLLLANVDMKELLDNFMSAQTVEELEKMVQKLKDAAAGVKQLKDGASKAAGSLKAHIQGRNRAEARKKVQQEKKTEQSEVQAQKKQAKDAAEQIKQQEKVLSPIFHIDWTEVDGADNKALGMPVAVVDGPGKGSVGSFDEPVLLTNTSMMAEFSKMAKAR